MKVHIGCSGWFYWGWRGRFYPEDLPTHRWFEHYAKHFKTVELNAPFYSWPRQATVRTWVKQARGRFVYCVKANRLITHDFRMEGTKMLAEQFCLDVGDPLGGRLGCILWQFPPSFRFTRARLKRICDQLRPRCRNVVEFRHKSWWTGEVYRALRRKGIIFCCVSAPRLPDKLVRTADEIYVRLHGASRWYRHDYTPQELSAWAEKIRKSGAKTAWIYFDNDRDAHAIKNAAALRRLLTRKTPPARARPRRSRTARG